MGTQPLTFTAEAAALPTNQLQWLKRVSFVVADNAGNGLDLSDMQLKFEVVSASLQTMKHLQIRIYNLAPSTAKQIQQEFTQVRLSAGYQGAGPYGVIFTGMVTMVRLGKENAVDSFVDIVAGDSDIGYNWSTTSAALAAGWTQADVHDRLVKALEPYQVTAGETPTLSTTRMPRGRVLYGMTRDQLRTFSLTNGMEWTIQDGQLKLTDETGYLPGGVITLSPSTGLVGSPDLTLDGLSCRALLNPNLGTGRAVQVETALINTVTFTSGEQINRGPLPPTLPQSQPSSNGLYKVYRLTHSGDTRGNEWYSEIVCVAADQTAKSLTFAEYGQYIGNR
jgi:hypothetical protein